MPVLDTQMWMGSSRREWGVPQEFLEKNSDLPLKNSGPLKNIILYEFYRKNMARKTPMMARTALPEKVKIATVTQEVIRRCKNTSRDLPPSHITEILETYISDLRRGGFKDEWISMTVNAGITGYGRMVKNEIEGKCPVNRSEKFSFTSRRFKKLCGKQSWFKQKTEKFNPSLKRKNLSGHNSPPPSAKKVKMDPGAESVLFVPYTPYSALQKQVQEAENLINAGSRCTKVKVIERNGSKLSNQLCNNTYWRNESCSNTECIPCIYNPGSCRKVNLCPSKGQPVSILGKATGHGQTGRVSTRQQSDSQT